MELTKWPRLLVAGDAVSEDQADDILVRTDGWYMATNDRSWQATVYRIAGIEVDDRYGWPATAALQDFRTRARVLDLSYLNNSQIASSWIGGPHGWCSWSGEIGCSTHNIGKWPSVEDVTEDWQSIAAAFPYLALRAQLVTDEGEGELAGEWVIGEGSVSYDPAPTRQLRIVNEPNIFGIFGPVSRERGCSEERLRKALATVLGDAP